MRRVTLGQVGGRVVYCGRTGDGLTSYLKDINSSWMQQPHSKDSSAAGAEAGSKTAPTVPLLNAVQAQQLADGSVVGLNPAEWLVDLFTQADRDGRGGDFADAYDASQLKQVGLSTASRLHGQTLLGRSGSQKALLEWA